METRNLKCLCPDKAYNKSEKHVPKISELDSRILKILLKDGRMGYDSIAEECEEPKNKIWKRCKAMEKKGIIKGATVQINFGQFGYAALATLLISIDVQQMDHAMGFTEKITEIRTYRQYNSVYNVRAFATLRDLNELDQIKQLIKHKLPTMGLKTYIWAGIRNMPENLNLAQVPVNRFDLECRYVLLWCWPSVRNFPCASLNFCYTANFGNLILYIKRLCYVSYHCY
ncbi:MAG: Lrp/AsnC family transcriptional regulator [Candidatus Bathyarchaeota archaeon]|nr:Lrp/AsnC family transcriptional regulator [Candidatus Bathyarchaeota archaeon]